MCRNQSNLWTKVVVMTALAFTACKQAGYQVLRPGTVTPQTFDGNKTIPPTARVEVIDQGVSVTWTYVGNKVDIRPTLDTLDPDYLGKSNCENPGIIQAAFDSGNGKKPVIDRLDCASLTVKEETYSQPGDYLIQMQVKSQDNEIAWASMTLRVVAKGTTREDIEGGFTIHAKPLLAGINQPIAFTGICELKGVLTISWDFADGSKADGAALQHPYAKAGQYRVTALCRNDAGRSLQASLTVVVIDGTPPTLPDVPVPVPGSNPNLPPPTTTPCDPTQGPCQNGSQVPQGGSQVPDNSGQTWSYESNCRCYYRYYR